MQGWVTKLFHCESNNFSTKATGCRDLSQTKERPFSIRLYKENKR